MNPMHPCGRWYVCMWPPANHPSPPRTTLGSSNETAGGCCKTLNWRQRDHIISYYLCCCCSFLREGDLKTILHCLSTKIVNTALDLAWAKTIDFDNTIAQFQLNFEGEKISNTACRDLPCLYALRWHSKTNNKVPAFSQYAKCICLNMWFRKLDEALFLSHIINPLLTKLVRSRWLDFSLVLFLRVYWPRLPHAWSITLTRMSFTKLGRVFRVKLKTNFFTSTC